jgi:indolepyruvate ferredoxin oxidoreductase
MATRHDPSALFTKDEGLIHLSGIQALVRLPLDQIRAERRRGAKVGMFISGYRGSPLGGLDQAIEAQTKLMREHDIFFSNGLNEDLACTAVWGTQMLHSVGHQKYDGVLGMWYAKAPGVDRSGDVLKHANYTGIQKNGAVLAVVGDDPSCKSSSLPSQSEPGLYHVGIPSLYPGNMQEILDLGLHGFALSRAAGLWIGLKIVTNVADGTGNAEVVPDRVRPVIPTLELDGRPFVPHMNLAMNVRPEALEMEYTLYNARLEMARRYARENNLNRVVIPNPNAWLGIITSGKTYHDLRQAFIEMGLDDEALRRYGIRVLKMGMLFPMEPTVVRDFANGLEEILVIEEKRPFLELFAKETLYGRANAPRIVGKLDEQEEPLLPYHGEFESDIIMRALVKRISQKARVESAEAWLKRLDEIHSRSKVVTLARPAWFCSGCPHNTSTQPLQGSFVSAGIGCHTMAMWMNRNVVMGTHMGAEGAQWIGMAPFTEVPHIFQNIGDGTYFHSGSLAMNYTAASPGVNITYKLLYNSHVSMTGGQEAMGNVPVPNVVSNLLASGAKRVIVTTDDIERYKGVGLPAGGEVWHRDRVMEAQAVLAHTKGTTVLVHDQECAAELRRLRGRGKRPDPATRVVINERVCEGCGDCGVKSNCVSVEAIDTEFGDKRRIHQPSCNKDYSCVRGFCPSFMTITPAEDVQKKWKTSKVPGVDRSLPGQAEPPLKASPKKVRRMPTLDREIPEPTFKVRGDEFSVHIMGIGGTGSVTVASTIGQAAMIDGKFSVGLDQTGLAQKGGPVISDIKLSAKRFEGSNKISDGSADLYLGFDILNTSDQKNLDKCHPDRTIAVVSTGKAQTGQMAADRTVRFPEVRALTRAIDNVTRASENIYLDGQAMAEGLFADNMATNMFMVGVAYQCGALPIAGKSIEAAIKEAGVAVDMGLLAFKWGRMAVIDREFVHAEIRKYEGGPAQAPQLTPSARAIVDSVGASGETKRLVEIRVADLIDYQDEAYAQRYADVVKRAVQAEKAATPDKIEFSEAVARFLYKLMAYKDEYEVARLHTDPAFLAKIEAQFKPGHKVVYHLAPPLISKRDPVTGDWQKRPYGHWILNGFKVLAKLKGLRGGALDIFGKTDERRHERQLIVDYVNMVDEICKKLSPANHAVAVQLARVPDEIRGYGHVKERNLKAAKETEAQLLQEFRTPRPVPVRQVA